MKKMIYDILNEVAECLRVSQLKKLQEVMLRFLDEHEKEPEPAGNSEYLTMFLDAKKIEGCSERTIIYYKSSVQHLLTSVEIPVRRMTTEDIRTYLSRYQNINNCTKVTIDNIQRNISSFFSWLEEEDYILKVR